MKVAYFNLFLTNQNVPNGNRPAINANALLLNGHFKSAPNVTIIEMYQINRMPCNHPVYFTAKGMSAAYFNGMATNKSNKKEIPSAWAIFVK